MGEKEVRICVEGRLLSGRLRIVFNKIYITEPELTTPGGLYA